MCRRGIIYYQERLATAAALWGVSMANPKINVETGRVPRPPSLAVAGLVILSAATAGIDRMQRRLVEHMYRRGETRESLMSKIDRYPLPKGFKLLMGEQVTSVENAAPSSIEVESVVEDA